jgi:hypothetical protein
VGTAAAGASAPASAGLVPVVDLFNTDGKQPQHTAKKLAPDGRSFIVYATQPIKRHQQVCLSYGELTNVDLLSQFGFVLTEEALSSDRAFVDCTKLLEERLNAQGGPEVRGHVDRTPGPFYMHI